VATVFGDRQGRLPDHVVSYLVLFVGATLANGSRSGEAVSAYQKALELKPNYMRAWANMGISQANLGNYDASARFYVRALGLNPGCV